MRPAVSPTYLYCVHIGECLSACAQTHVRIYMLYMPQPQMYTYTHRYNVLYAFSYAKFVCINISARCTLSFSKSSSDMFIMWSGAFVLLRTEQQHSRCAPDVFYQQLSSPSSSVLSAAESSEWYITKYHRTAGVACECVCSTCTYVCWFNQRKVQEKRRRTSAYTSSKHNVIVIYVVFVCVCVCMCASNLSFSYLL